MSSEQKNQDNSKDSEKPQTNSKDSAKENYEKIIAAKNAQIAKLEERGTRNSDDIAPGIHKQYTFEGGYRNGYEDGSVKKANEKHQAKVAAELRGQ